MACRVQPSFPAFVRLPAAFAILSLALAGCSKFDRAERPAWRNQAEEACLAQHLVEETEFLRPAKAIDGPGICGLNHPFRVYALAGGTVRLNSASILDCSMIPMLDAWIKDVVQPDAQARFGEPVVQINTMGTYSCRGINNMSGAKLSEHAFGNAMDVGGFVLASGREITVTHGWKSTDEQESAFLRDSHAGACNYFTTVLGPGYNAFHYNHVHLDLAMHGNTSRGPRRYCKPVPGAQTPAPQLDTLPDPPAIEEELDIAQTPMPRPSYAAGEGTDFVASAPPPVPPSYRPPARLAPVSVAGMARGPTVTAAPRLDPPLQVAALPRAAAPRRDATSRDPDQAGIDADGQATPQRGGIPEGVPADWDITSLMKSRNIR